jgi:hypothetical protein
MRHSYLFFSVKLNFDDIIKRKTNKNTTVPNSNLQMVETKTTPLKHIHNNTPSWLCAGT